MAENELKPCPFCGPQQTAPQVFVTEEGSSIRCMSCGSSTDHYLDVRSATEVWNTRVGEDVERERANIANNAAEYMYQIALRGGATIPRDVFVSVLAHLVSAHSLLKGGGKKAAASDTIFGIMLTDMQEAIDKARTVIRGKE